MAVSCPESVGWVAVNDLSLSDHIMDIYLMIVMKFKFLHVVGIYVHIYDVRKFCLSSFILWVYISYGIYIYTYIHLT